jgi:hypothetical protein
MERAARASPVRAGYGRIHGISRKIWASVLYTRCCCAGADVGRLACTGAGSAAGGLTAGAASTATGVGVGRRRATTRVAGRGAGLGGRRCDARVGAEVGPPSIDDTTTCRRPAVGASSSPLPPAAARSRWRPSSATAPLLLHAAAAINAATPAIRPTRPCEIFIAVLPGVAGANVPHTSDTTDEPTIPSLTPIRDSCCVSTEAILCSVEIRQKASWAPISPTYSAARWTC